MRASCSLLIPNLNALQLRQTENSQRLKLNGTDWYAGGQCPPYGISRVSTIQNARFSERSQRLAAQLRAAGIEPEA